MKKEIKIIIGPSKTFNNPLPSNGPRPKYVSKAKELFGGIIKHWDIKKIEKNYGISNNLALKVKEMHDTHADNFYNAIELFGGTVFKQLKLSQYDNDWMNEHVLIIDPLYGPVKPFETIGKYRLDMKTKISVNLKKYWVNEIQEELKGYDVIDLASKEWTDWLNIEIRSVELDNSLQIKVARGKALHNLIKNK